MHSAGAFRYSRWDGSQDELLIGVEDLFDLVADRLLDGLDAALALRDLLADPDAELSRRVFVAGARRIHLDLVDSDEVVELLIGELVEAGLLGREEDGLVLRPGGVRRIAERAARQLFARTRSGAIGRHAEARTGLGGEPSEELRPFEHGDEFRIDVAASLRAALPQAGPAPPLRLDRSHLLVTRSLARRRASTVLALDLSQSMVQRGHAAVARRVAVALDALVRTRFPDDVLHTVAFADRAHLVPPGHLPRLRGHDSANGTNLQHALELSRDLLRRAPRSERQVVVVTDGEPTAYLDGGVVRLTYPPSFHTLDRTLREVERCTRDGIVVNIFMLERRRQLVEFVDLVVRMNGGRAFFVDGARLGEYAVRSYVRGGA